MISFKDKAILMCRIFFIFPAISLAFAPTRDLSADSQNRSCVSFSQLDPKQAEKAPPKEVKIDFQAQNKTKDEQKDNEETLALDEPKENAPQLPPETLPKNLVSTFDLIAQENPQEALPAANPSGQSEAQTNAQTPEQGSGAASEQAPTVVERAPSQQELQAQAEAQGPVINFNNVSIVEFLRFVSRLTGRNFIYDPQDLQFPVTIISESPASLEDIMAALLQNLRIHDFDLIEQGSSFLIHRNKTVRNPPELFQENTPPGQEPQLVTQVFLIEYVDPARVGAIIKTMLSKDALVELIPESKRLIVTDIYTNINKITELLKAIDSPNSGLEIGQYVSQNATPASLISLTTQLLAPMTKGQTFILVPNTPANSVFIVSSSFLVEKALSIMQIIDLGENESRILSFDQLKFNAELAKRLKEQVQARISAQAPKGFTEEELKNLTDDEIRKLLNERGLSDEEIARLTKDQKHSILKEENIEFGPFAAAKKAELRQKKVFESNLPLGQVESTQFLIHKLQYRRSADIVTALHAIAASLQSTTIGSSPQSDLITTLNTIQTIDENNSIVITGTSTTLQRAKDLINEIDVPVRQVLIEALVLDTTITNSLNFGVQYGINWKREDFSFSAGSFQNNSGTIPNSLGSFSGTTPPSLTSLNLFGTINPSTGTNSGIMGSPLEGLTAGSIGRRLIHKNTGFVSFAAVVNAVRDDEDINIIFNPKITTEHNVPAELFVGQQIGIKGQSISNDTGTIVTTNFNTQNTGISLKVTPLISSKDTITLIIEQEISSANQAQVLAQGQPNAPPATINVTRTVTRVHLPNEYFLVMSGSIQETRDYLRSSIPCLGALPIIGNAFANNNVDQNNKRNLMMFIRPTLIDTDVDIEEVTKKQQDIFYQKSVPMKEQKTAVDDLIDILNLDP